MCAAVAQIGAGKLTHSFPALGAGLVAEPSNVRSFAKNQTLLLAPRPEPLRPLVQLLGARPLWHQQHSLTVDVWQPGKVLQHLLAIVTVVDDELQLVRSELHQLPNHLWSMSTLLVAVMPAGVLTGVGSRAEQLGADRHQVGSNRSEVRASGLDGDMFAELGEPLAQFGDLRRQQRFSPGDHHMLALEPMDLGHQAIERPLLAGGLP